jgi:very-short-patch-repair endonuclease
MKKKILILFAKELRKNSTDAEKKLWECLRRKGINRLKFRRLEPIGDFIVDFVCYEKKLAIELDGAQHLNQKYYDKDRDNWLKGNGFSVLRFRNDDVLKNINDILEIIKQSCK